MNCILGGPLRILVCLKPCLSRIVCCLLTTPTHKYHADVKFVLLYFRFCSGNIGREENDYRTQNVNSELRCLHDRGPSPNHG